MSLTTVSPQLFDALRQKMSQASVRTLSWKNWPTLVSVTMDQTLPDVLNILNSNNVLSAAVFETPGDRSSASFNGFVDLFQITMFAVDLCEFEDRPIRFSSDYFEKSQRFRTTTIRDIIDQGMYGEYKRPLRDTSSVFLAFETLARRFKTLHRVGLVNDVGRVIGTVTQSMMIKQLNEKMLSFGDARVITVAQMRRFRFLATVDDDSTALDAFQVMRDREINCVGICNDAGALVDVISSRDIRGISPGTANFQVLWDNVLAYKNKIRQRYPPTTGPKCVTVRNTDTLATIINKMVTRKVHRVFVVDEFMNPSDIISQGDVLRYIHKHAVPGYYIK
jgi:CBS-domain-containing membrane protein